MILAIDIGNTNIVIGGYVDDKLELVARINTEKNKTEDEYIVLIKDIILSKSHSLEEIDGAIISSVVPQTTYILKTALDMLFNIDTIIVSMNINTGITIKYADPNQIGADFICGLVGVAEKYELPCIVIDFGTATKTSVINKEKEFIGAAIMPGIGISLDALASKTAQLPNISLNFPPKSIMGNNTIDCMKAGIVYGNACMVDGIVKMHKDELGEEIRVIATGGLAKHIVKHCKEEIIYDQDLLLDGLNKLYKMNKK
jgi:type III pantothenate kinase